MTTLTPCGVRIAGAGSAVPKRVVTNVDLESMMDTNDEWIRQRTGIRERRVCDQEVEGTFTLSRDALRIALEDAGMPGSDLDLIILATVTMEMTCPSTAARVARELDCGNVAAFDLVAACSGFVYGLNIADSLIRSGRHKRIGVIGCDAMSTVVDFSERTVSILFGDAAGAVVLERDDEDHSAGCLYQTMNGDSTLWESLYMPRREQDLPDFDKDNAIRLGYLRMNGREVYRFAVTKFREVIQETLEANNLTVDDISQFVVHQSNLRIINAAKEKLGLPDDKVLINIDQFGNSSAGSVGMCFHQLWRDGKIKRGDLVIFVAFGGGMTWASSLWRV